MVALLPRANLLLFKDRRDALQHGGGAGDNGHAAVKRYHGFTCLAGRPARRHARRRKPFHHVVLISRQLSSLVRASAARVRAVRLLRIAEHAVHVADNGAGEGVGGERDAVHLGHPAAYRVRSERRRGEMAAGGAPGED